MYNNKAEYDKAREESRRLEFKLHTARSQGNAEEQSQILRTLIPVKHNFLLHKICFRLNKASESLTKGQRRRIKKLAKRLLVSTSTVRANLNEEVLSTLDMIAKMSEGCNQHFFLMVARLGNTPSGEVTEYETYVELTGDNIKRALRVLVKITMNRRSLDVAHLAQRAQLSRTTVKNVLAEESTVIPTWDTLLALMYAMGLTVDSRITPNSKPPGKYHFRYVIKLD